MSAEELDQIYRVLEGVEGVTWIGPFRFVAHRDIPPNEVHLVQAGRCVGKIIFPPPEGTPLGFGGTDRRGCPVQQGKS